MHWPPIWAVLVSFPRNHAQILHNNSLINLLTLDAAREQGVKRYLYTSSACIYPEYKQLDTNVTPLKESDAYPAQPQDAYGWEKLVTNGFAPTIVKITSWRRASSAFTIFLESAALGMADAKKPQRHCVVKLQCPS
jgi:UDP-glucose 4-epimerase